MDDVVELVITDRIHYHGRMAWLKEHDGIVRDNTIWGMWMLGHGDINLTVKADIALLYKMKWG